MLYDLAAEMRDRPKVISTSILLGFPYADVEEMGSAFVAVCESSGISSWTGPASLRYLVRIA